MTLARSAESDKPTLAILRASLLLLIPALAGIVVFWASVAAASSAR